MEIKELHFETRKDAEEVLYNLRDCIRDYGNATGEDLCDLVGIEPNFIDHKYGWLTLDKAYIMKTRGSYALFLPKPILLEGHNLNHNKLNCPSPKTNTVTFVIQNRDTYFGPFTICPKEVLQKTYLDSIGKNIDYFGVQRKIIGVAITEESITVTLE